MDVNGWNRTTQGTQVQLVLGMYEAQGLVTLMERAEKEFFSMDGNEFMVLKDILSKLKPKMREVL